MIPTPCGHAPSPGLRVVVFLNGGGDIFRSLPGIAALEEVEELFVTPRDVDIPALARLHGLALFIASDAGTLRAVLPFFFASTTTPALLVIDTRQAPNSEVLESYYQSLKIS